MSRCANDFHIHGFETRLRVIWRYRRDHGGDMFAQAREIDWRLARGGAKIRGVVRRCGSSAYGKQGIARNSLRQPAAS
jgi:hypothetical protein